MSEHKLEANFSMLTMSIASSAAMAMGLAPGPDESFQTDERMAKFNIDLLIMLKDKTKNNLNSEEQKFIDSVVTDLQLKFVQTFKK